MSILTKIKDNDNAMDFLYAILFGLLSIYFGSFKLFIPGFEGVSSDFREIPLLISILYFRKPYFIILACLITMLSTSSIYYSSLFVMHLAGLSFAWFYYKKLFQGIKHATQKLLGWVSMVVLYFLVFLIPILLITYQIIKPSDTFNFFDEYIKTINASTFEIIATIIITALYLMQFEAKNTLLSHKSTLEHIVEKRTQELAVSNKKLKALNSELVASNEEVKTHNENLDELVKKRSKKIEEQLNLFHEYADINSHEVRAPLARILGLLYIIEREEDKQEKAELIKRINKAAKELDDVIRHMNRLLEKETFPTPKV